MASSSPPPPPTTSPSTSRLYLESSSILKPTVISSNSTKIPQSISLLRHQRLQSYSEVAQLHAQLVVSGLFDAIPTTSGKLVYSYLSLSCFNQASTVFRKIASPDVFAYNTMIRGLTEDNSPHQSILLYKRMLLEGLIPDNYTYTYVLKACSKIENAVFEGKQVHCQVIKTKRKRRIPVDETHINSSLIHMYSLDQSQLQSAELVLRKFEEDNNNIINNSMISGYFRHGFVEDAKRLFDKMVTKDEATWSSMVSGYTKSNMYVEALSAFQEMMSSDITPNESTVVSAVTACSRLGALDKGRKIHIYVDKIKLKSSLTIKTALIDMYAKCGSIDASYEIFKKMQKRDVVTWGAIISGFAIHGQAQKCFELFDEMVNYGIQPNCIVFVGILSACSHVGYVEEGYYYFNQMVRRFKIRPSIEHYGCMVDLLGRAGRLAEAEELIISMPNEPNAITWGSLLASCRTHRDSERGKRAFKRLVQLEPKSGDRYKLGGQMFAASGEMEKAIEVRKMIKEREMNTTCGSSFIEVDGFVHEFIVGDTNHTEAKEIYMVLEDIHRKLEK